MPIQADQSGAEDLQTALQAYTKCPLHLLTRLDRPASGLVLATKPSTQQAYFQKLLSEQRLEKTYYAITGQPPAAPSGEFIHWLDPKPRNNKSAVSSSVVPGYQRAHLTYRILASSERYHLWEINLISGRHHQIRAQLGFMGCPIQGDTKYGAPRANRSHFIHLHSARLSFPHPQTQQSEVYTRQPDMSMGLWKLFATEFASLSHE